MAGMRLADASGMKTPIGNLMNAQHAVLETTQSISLKGVETATRFFDLQTQATQGMLAAGSAAPRAGPPDALALANGMAEYTRRSVALAWQTQAEMVQLLTQQAGQVQTLLAEILSAGLLGAVSLHDPTLHGMRPI